MMKKYLLLFIVFYSCGETYIPKPKGWLRLEYPKPIYEKTEKNNFSFERSKYSQIKIKKGSWFDLHYPNMKATIHTTYKPVKNNLNVLLKEVNKLAYEHSIKADGILEHPFENKKRKVYGMIYELKGDVASSLQFFVTDSVKHVFCGSLYFYTKPNQDSLKPAINYIKNDVIQIIETFEWK